MMQFNNLVAILLLVIFCEAYALKGNRLQSRRLDNGARRKMQGKKGLEGKKCKKHLPKKDDDEDDDVDYDEVVECPLIIITPECDALRSGETPSSNGAAGAALNLEVTTTAEDAIARLNQALDEAALIAVNCDVYADRELQELQELENMGLPNITVLVTLNGYTVGDLNEVSNDCTTTTENCTVYQTPFTMYYSGNATPAHLNSFGYALASAVERKVDDDEYDEVADVHFVYVDETSLRLVASQSGVQSQRTKVGLIAGGAVGGLALLGGVAGFMYYRKRSSSI